MDINAATTVVTVSYLGIVLLSPGYVLFQHGMLHEEGTLLLKPPRDCMMQVVKLVLCSSHFVLQRPNCELRFWASDL